MIKRPALFVRHDICKDSASGVCGGGLAWFRSIEGCDDAKYIEIDGNKTMTTAGCAGSSTRGELRIGSDIDPNETHLKNVMGHELGHALNLGHLSNTNSHINRSVMTGGDKPHLWYYDKACVEEVAQASDLGGRDVDYRYSQRTAGGSWSAVQTHTNPTERGFIGSGVVSSSYGNPYYSLYTSYRGTNRIRYGAAGTNGVLNFGSSSTPSSWLHDVWTSPVFFSPLERDPQDCEANRANYVLEVEFSDPPQHRYLRTNGAGIFNSGYAGRYAICSSVIDCSTNYDYLYGHIPMTAGYDGVTDNSIFGRVNTDRPVSSSGEIYLHRGFVVDWSNRLWAGVQIPTTNLPTVQNWNLEAKTDAPVGIACARDRTDWDDNCIVAWSDRGHPQGYMLYAFFGIQAAGSLGMTTEAVRRSSIRGGPRTAFQLPSWLASSSSRGR